MDNARVTYLVSGIVLQLVNTDLISEREKRAGLLLRSNF